jgi:hypothetical protein
VKSDVFVIKCIIYLLSPSSHFLTKNQQTLVSVPFSWVPNKNFRVSKCHGYRASAFIMSLNFLLFLLSHSFISIKKVDVLRETNVINWTGPSWFIKYLPCPETSKYSTLLFAKTMIHYAARKEELVPSLKQKIKINWYFKFTILKSVALNFISHFLFHLQADVHISKNYT